MKLKKRINGSWTDIPYYINTTMTDSLTILPATLYTDNSEIVVGIKGNAIQSGVPTPESPIIPQGTGDNTGNLFDISTAVLGKWINSAGEEKTSSVATQEYKLNHTDYIPVEPSTEYVFSYDGDYSVASTAAMCWFNADKEIISKSDYSISGQKVYSFSATAPSNAAYCIVNFSGYNGVGKSDMIFAVGSTAPSYEPFGIKIPISLGGVNLWDEDYTEINTNAIYRPLFVGDGMFTLSTNFKSNNNITDIFLLSGNVSSGINSSTNGAYEGKNITAQSVDGYITIAYRANARTSSGSLPYCKTMLNRGSTAISYEPYNHTTTPIYLGEVQSTRSIKKLVFTGEESFVYDSTYTRFRFTMPNSLILGARRTPVICTHFSAITDGRPIEDVPQNTIYSDSATLNRWWIEAEDFTSANDFKTYLAAQYAAGTPVTIWYILTTEETGIVNEPLMKIGDYADEIINISVPTIVGTNTFNIGTVVQPSEVTLYYHGWHPINNVHEHDNGVWN